VRGSRRASDVFSVTAQQERRLPDHGRRLRVERENATMNIKVVFTGRSYHLAEMLPDELTLSENATLADAISELQSRLPAEERLPSSCLVTVAGEHLGTLDNHRERQLVHGEELVLIAPVAGG
jgi:molybdopterin converting factor small subunit